VSGLDAIDVRVEGLGSLATDNVLPLLHEIRHALERLVSTDEPTTIDLSSIPFSQYDRDRLFKALGEGEVHARVDSFGASSVRETAFPGVWLVQHANPRDEELSLYIEISRLPAILTTPVADVEDSAAALAARLAG